MKNSSQISLILALIGLIGGMIMKGVSPVALIVPAAWLIIFVGTAASLFMAFPYDEIMKFPKLMKIAFTPPTSHNNEHLIKMFIEWASVARREGLLALESKVEEIEDDFLKNGMKMIIDGNEQEFVHDVLSEEITQMEDRHKVGATVFAQGGSYAPTLGVLGAVVGLIAALGNLADINALGHAIAAAFIATFYGIFMGYVIFNPLANKMKRLSKREVEVKHIMLEGLMAIQAGISTIAIEQKLSVYLSPSEKKALEQAKNSGGGKDE